MSATISYLALLLAQTLHLLHHRLAWRHISFVEVISAGVLCAPPMLLPMVPGWAFVAVHAVLIAVQIAGSVWIDRLSPDWRD